MSLCIIIPTLSRVDVLERTICALDEQTIKPGRIIIIDDGSSSEAVNRIEHFIKAVDLPITLMENSPQRGPAAARNKGILESREDLLLFMNDDTIPSSQAFLESHLNFAARFPEFAILGKLKWHPETPNCFLSAPWTSKLGFEVGYNMASGQPLDFNKFCSANVLIPKKLLRGCLFDENFPHAALEDTELGYRLHKRGALLKYNPDAILLHLHLYTPEMVIRRQEMVGESLGYFIKCHPELEKIFRPKLNKFLSAFLRLFLKKPFKYLLTADVRLFLQGLTSKYNAFWNNYNPKFCPPCFLAKARRGDKICPEGVVRQIRRGFADFTR